MAVTYHGTPSQKPTGGCGDTASPRENQPPGKEENRRKRMRVRKTKTVSGMHKHKNKQKDREGDEKEEEKERRKGGWHATLYHNCRRRLRRGFLTDSAEAAIFPQPHPVVLEEGGSKKMALREGGGAQLRI